DERPLAPEYLERGDRRGAGEGIARVGVSVEERLELVVAPEEALIDPLGCEGRGERHVAAGDPLRETEQIGGDALLLAGEHRPRAPEARRDLVADEQHPVALAETLHRA